MLELVVSAVNSTPDVGVFANLAKAVESIFILLSVLGIGLVSVGIFGAPVWIILWLVIRSATKRSN
jgi:hypothetical protein